MPNRMHGQQNVAYSRFDITPIQPSAADHGAEVGRDLVEQYDISVRIAILGSRHEGCPVVIGLNGMSNDGAAFSGMHVAFLSERAAHHVVMGRSEAAEDKKIIPFGNIAY
jgi:hypothetical protein